MDGPQVFLFLVCFDCTKKSKLKGVCWDLIFAHDPFVDWFCVYRLNLEWIVCFEVLKISLNWEMLVVFLLTCKAAKWSQLES